MSKETAPRILAVEDNPDTQLLLRYLLRSEYSLEVVPHIDDALRAAREGGFDLFVLDINLGEERSGLDLLKELRRMPAYEDTPALALTAYAMPGDKERFLNAGFETYIAKPFTRKELHTALESMLESLNRR